MATLNEIAYNIRNIAYGGVSNSEQNVSIRQIKFWIHYYRAETIKELSLKGQSIPYEFYQQHDIVRADVPYMLANPAYEGLLTAYALASPNSLVAYSARTADIAGEALTSGNNNDVNPIMDYHGREFYDSKGLRQAGDFGYLDIIIPSLVNVHNGLANLQLRKVHSEFQQHTSTVPVPIVSYDEYLNSKYNRFTKDSPKGCLTDGYQGSSRLRIGRLQSVFTKQTDTSVIPDPIRDVIPYQVTMSLLLNDPTLASSWVDDDNTYPISQYFISQLNQRILTKELNVSLSTNSDLITDNADTTKIVQPQTQRQVRKR